MNWKYKMSTASEKKSSLCVNLQKRWIDLYSWRRKSCTKTVFFSRKKITCVSKFQLCLWLKDVDPYLPRIRWYSSSSPLSEKNKCWMFFEVAENPKSPFREEKWLREGLLAVVDYRHLIKHQYSNTLFRTLPFQIFDIMI